MCWHQLLIRKKGEFAHIPEQYTRTGFARARVDGVIYALDEFPELQKTYKHDIEIVVDRIVMKADVVSRVTQSVEQALDIASGVVQLLDADTGDIYVQSTVCLRRSPRRRHPRARATAL